jgi:hypothetical protein
MTKILQNGLKCLQNPLIMKLLLNKFKKYNFDFKVLKSEENPLFKKLLISMGTSTKSQNFLRLTNFYGMKNVKLLTNVKPLWKSNQKDTQTI